MLKTLIVSLLVGVIYSTAGEILFAVDILKGMPDLISFEITAGATIGMYIEKKIG